MFFNLFTKSHSLCDEREVNITSLLSNKIKKFGIHFSSKNWNEILESFNLRHKIIKEKYGSTTIGKAGFENRQDFSIKEFFEFLSQ